MKQLLRCLLFSLALLVTMASRIWADDLIIMTHEIKSFPLGIGSSADKFLWSKHMTVLEKMARLVKTDSMLSIEIVGWVDANRFLGKHHDPLNSGLALSRTNPVVNKFEELGVPTEKIRISIRESLEKGGDYRKVVIKIIRRALPTLDVNRSSYVTHQELCDEIENLTADGKYATVTRNHFLQVLSLVEVGAGITTSPLGRLLADAHGRIGNRTISMEIEVGHSWVAKQKQLNSEQTESMSFDYQMIGGRLLYNLWNESVHLTAGWERWEERSRLYGRYTEKQEGYSCGVRWHIGKYLSLSIYYLRAERNRYLVDKVFWVNRFRFTLSVDNIWRKQ